MIIRCRIGIHLTILDRERLRVTKQTEGTLFVDFIDVKNKKLVWQGIGSGALGARTGAKKVERIQTFVKEIIANYPPGKEKIKFNC